MTHEDDSLDSWQRCDPERGTHYHGGGPYCECGAQPSYSEDVAVEQEESHGRAD